MKEIYVKLDDCKDIKKYLTTDRLLISLEEIIENFSEALYEIEILKEKIQDLENDIKDNYEPKKNDPYEEYGISREDFV